MDAEIFPRLRAVCDLQVAEIREYAGLHDYDGRVQDLSPDGVTAAVARLGGPALNDPHDEAHLTTAEDHQRVLFAELAQHRSNPTYHVGNLDLACYDRDYAPADVRAEARRRHLRAWPDAVEMAVESLDRVPAPVAAALLPAVRGLAAGLDGGGADADGTDRPQEREVERALAAHARFIGHVERLAAEGSPETALGSAALSRLMSSAEGMAVDLAALSVEADAERDRLTGMLGEACARLDADRTPAQIIPELLADHPDIDGVLDEARAQTAEVIAFTRERQLAPHVDGECTVGPAPASRSWAMAMMSWAAPYEADAPSRYYVTPPDPSWPAEDVEEWLSVFSRTTLPAITAHEVAPGHFAHGRTLRRVTSPVRRTLMSAAFIEGWAHHVEEVFVEEGFRAEDPRFAIGVCIEALVRVTRLAAAIGLHTGAMTIEDATARFMADAFYGRAAAASEARRGTFDPTYGRYTWGKLAIRRLREQARDRWGSAYSLQRFHAAMLDLGAPPLGLLGTALDRG